MEAHIELINFVFSIDSFFRAGETVGYMDRIEEDFRPGMESLGVSFYVI